MKIPIYIQALTLPVYKHTYSVCKIHNSKYLGHGLRANAFFSYTMTKIIVDWSSDGIFVIWTQRVSSTWVHSVLRLQYLLALQERFKRVCYFASPQSIQKQLGMLI